jgi:membrane protein
MTKLLSNLPSLFKLAFEDWKQDNASRLSAALAYYTIFSLAPLLIIVIAITGLIWEEGAVRAQLMSQIQSLVGTEGAEFVASLLNNRDSPGEDIVVLAIGMITLLFGALGVFNELHNSLNIILNVEEERPKNFLHAVKKILIDRLLSFTMILGIGFLLLVSLVVTAGLSATQETIGNAFPMSEFISQVVNVVISLGVTTVLFALIFRFLPDAKIHWRDVWIGAFITSLLFSLGKTAIGLYLGNSAVASVFGAAGALVLLLLWIYYSAQILFFGAEFMQVYANIYGSKIVPEGEEKTAQREPKGTRQLKGQSVLPASAKITISARESQLERENRQTGLILLGMMITSFLMGMFTTIFGLKKR